MSKIINIRKVAKKINKTICYKTEWQDTINASYGGSIELIFKKQPDGSYIVYENIPNSPIIQITLATFSYDEYIIFARIK